MERLNLRELRGPKPLREIAAALGITPQMLGKIELKRRRPSLCLAQKIANYYGVIVEQIFFDDGRDDSCHKYSSYQKAPPACGGWGKGGGLREVSK